MHDDNNFADGGGGGKAKAVVADYTSRCCILTDAYLPCQAEHEVPAFKNADLVNKDKTTTPLFPAPCNPDLL